MKDKATWFAILAVIGALLVAGAASAEMIAHYDMNETGNVLNDSIGTNSQIILVGSPTRTADPWGGTAVTFNGTSQYGYCQWSQNVSNLWQISTAGAIEFWYYRPTGSHTSAFMGFFDSYGTGAWEDQRLYVYNDAYFPTYINGVTADGTDYGVAWGTPGSLLNDSWNHMVFTWGGGTQQLFENGVQIGSTSSAGPGLTDMNFYLAYGYGLGNAYYQGSLDEVSIWNSQLSAADVLQHYQSKANLKGFIAGHVDLEDVVAGFKREMVGVEIQLRLPGQTNPIQTIVTLLDANGNYSPIEVTVGTYDVAVSAYGWLQAVASNVTVSADATATASVSLKNGDPDGDNAVTTVDLNNTLNNIDQRGAE